MEPLPDWLSSAKAEIASTPEWLQLSDELLRAVRIALSAQGVTSFARLDAAEQRAIVRSAAESVRGSARFRLFSTSAWRLLDLYVDAEANQRVGSASTPSEGIARGSRAAARAPSKSVSIEVLSAEGCTALLSRLSLEETGGSCLSYLLGAQLPPHLRRAVWRRLLQQPAVADDYRARCAGGRLAVLSARDSTVLFESRSMLAEALTASEAAEAESSALADSEPGWAGGSLAAAGLGGLPGLPGLPGLGGLQGVDADGHGPLSLLARLKCALSYHDMLRPIIDRKCYFWMVPFAVAFSADYAVDSAHERARRLGSGGGNGHASDSTTLGGSTKPTLVSEADEDLALLAELYAALLKQPRPAIPLEPDAANSRKRGESIFGDEFDACLSAADPSLWAHLGAVLNGRPPPAEAALEAAPSSAEGEGEGGAAGSDSGATAGAAPAKRAPPHFDGDGSLLPSTPVRVLARVPVDRLFVGTVPVRTTLFIWDTCLLASWFLLAPLSAAWLIALREHLLEARTEAELRSALARTSRVLSAEALQKTMEAHFMPRLRESLGVPLRTDLDYLAFGEPHAHAQRTTRYLDQFHTQLAVRRPKLPSPPRPSSQARSSARSRGADALGGAEPPGGVESGSSAATARSKQRSESQRGSDKPSEASSDEASSDDDKSSSAHDLDMRSEDKDESESDASSRSSDESSDDDRTSARTGESSERKARSQPRSRGAKSDASDSQSETASSRR